MKKQFCVKGFFVVVLLLLLILFISSCSIISSIVTDDSAYEWKEYLHDYFIEPPFLATVRPADCEKWVTEFVSVTEIYAVTTMSFPYTQEIDYDKLCKELEAAAKDVDKKFPGKYKTEFNVFYDNNYYGEACWRVTFKRRCESVFSMT